MTPLAWGIVIGFVGFHVVYFAVFAYVWYRTVTKEHRQPEQVAQDYRRIRDMIRDGTTHDRRN